MQSNRFKEEEFIIMETPFHMEPHWELSLENSNCNCSHAQIDMLIHKGIISQIDLEIMKALACYPYLNSSNLTFYMNNLSPLHEFYQKGNYNSNLKKLKKAGIIACYHFTSIASGSVQELPHQISVSPLRLYRLTPGSYTYIAPIMEHIHPLTTAPFSTPRKLAVAALNQFLLRFHYYYAHNIRKLSYLCTFKIGSNPFIIDAVLYFESKSNLLETNDFISIFVFTIRNHKNWIKETINRLQMLKVWLNRHKTTVPFIILLIENLDMITSLSMQLYSSSSIRFPLYFLPDTLLTHYAPLSCIYTCEIIENKITSIRHTILI